ncbi:MAG: TspO/MBR family protein [Fibrobacteria bacterium]
MAGNFAWSFLFFRFRLIGAALIDIVLIWISILLLIMAYRRISAVAAILQVPYLLWVARYHPQRGHLANELSRRLTFRGTSPG